MPLFQAAGSLFFFAHVPRCGGSSVENYLKARFGPLALLDRLFLSVPETERWSRSSPQHIPAAALARLFPESWIRGSFAVVRHPEDRVRSLFLFQRDIEKTIAPDAAFETWLTDLPSWREQAPHILDNHPRPMTELVPENARIFRLEEGLDPIVEWFDDLEGAKRGPRKIGQANEYAARLEARGEEPGPPPILTAVSRDLLRELYAADFERFGYEPREGDAETPVAADPDAAPENAAPENVVPDNAAPDNKETPSL